MKKVNNKKAVNNLALSGIKAKLNKYLILVLAVILTSLLFSTLFTVGGSMFNEIQESTMRQVGGKFHAGFKYLTEAEYDQVKDDPKLKSISYRILVGMDVTKELNKLHIEYYYGQDENAKGSFCYPAAGQMPEAEDEAVISTVILDALDMPYEIGSKVKLSIKNDKDTVEKEFTLCGYYEGDPISPAQMVYVSKAFQEEFSPSPTTPLPESDGSYYGRYTVDFFFSNSINIEDKVFELIERTGIRSDVDYGINWAYGASEIDPGVVIMCVVLLITFMFAGYLIIYNIFDINIISDIQEFGLLKTIGTSERQLKRIVMKRANIISVIGIPIGIGLGVIVSTFLLPIVSGEFITVNVGKGELHYNIWILIGAMIFSYLTVVFSAGKPCRKASRVSPIETVKFTEERGKNGKPKKKYVTVILSISLALVVLNSVYGFVSGFSMDNFVSNMIISDFSVQDATLDNPGLDYRNTESIDVDLMDTLRNIDGVNDIGAIYLKEGTQEFSDETWAKIEENVLNSDLFNQKMEYYGYKDTEKEDYLNHLREKKILFGKTYGMAEYAVSKLEVIETIDGSDKIDWDKFSSGNYVLMNQFKSDEGSENYLKPGDKIQIRSNDPIYGKLVTVTAQDGTKYEYMSYDNAPVKEYEIYAIVSIPTPMEFRAYSLEECDYVLPEDEFIAMYGSEWKAMRVLLDVEDSKEESVNDWLKNYTTKVNKDMNYDSKDSIIDEYRSFGNMIKIVGTVVAVILGIIGLMNFANTIITSIIVRSRELAMLEAVGMTGKQQTLSMVKDGSVYLIWSAIVSIILSSILSIVLVRPITDFIPMFNWNFTLTPIFICLPFIAAMILIIPVIAYKKLSKRSVVDRLRIE